jgi:hypothetical protein
MNLELQLRQLIRSNGSSGIPQLKNGLCQTLAFHLMRKKGDSRKLPDEKIEEPIPLKLPKL